MRFNGLCALFVVLCVTCSNGCSLFQGVRDYLDYNDVTNDFVMGWRNKAWAATAWHERKCIFDGHPELRALGIGFRDGYLNVAAGGDGCPPPVPPRSFWTWKYQTAEGQQKVAAWFEGYTYGAQAADEENAGEFQDIQVSYAIEHQYSPEFLTGGMQFVEGMGDQGELLPGGEMFPLPETEPEAANGDQFRAIPFPGLDGPR